MRSLSRGEGTLLSMLAHRLRRVSPLAIMGRWPCLCMLVWLASRLCRKHGQPECICPLAETGRGWRLPELSLVLAGRARGRMDRSLRAAAFHLGATAAGDRGRDPKHAADAAREGVAGEEPPGRDRHRRAHAREPRALHRLRGQRAAAVTARLRRVLRVIRVHLDGDVGLPGRLHGAGPRRQRRRLRRLLLLLPVGRRAAAASARAQCAPARIPLGPLRLCLVHGAAVAAGRGSVAICSPRRARASCAGWSSR